MSLRVMINRVSEHKSMRTRFWKSVLIDSLLYPLSYLYFRGVTVEPQTLST